MSGRAGVIVTGTEVLTGRVSDRNGPWLADQLRQLGVDIAQLIVVGDRPDDLRQALRFLAASGVDLIITSGGLGPTADDLTAQVVGDWQGRPSELDEMLERQVGQIVARFSAGRGWHTDPAATAAATRKQALVPLGATVLPPVGAAPGLVVPVAEGRTGPLVVMLPGPPRELQGMWPSAIADAHVRAALAERHKLRQRTIRLWNVPESELAATLRAYGTQLDGLEITTCLSEGELEIVTRYPPAEQDAYDGLAAHIMASHARAVFSPDGRTVDDIVSDGLLAAHLSIATAESCTAGMLASRLTERPGSSAYFLGGVVSYANSAKRELLGVPIDLFDTVGAVSAEVAAAMADGVRTRFGADIGVGITGIAGPGGATRDKPVGLVRLCVTGPDAYHRPAGDGARFAR